MVQIRRHSQRNKAHSDPADSYYAMIAKFMEPWMKRAKCGEADASAFHANEAGRTIWSEEQQDYVPAHPTRFWAREAIMICGRCPVLRECDQYAVRNNIQDNSVWGGKVRKAKDSKGNVRHAPQGTLYNRVYGEEW